ncbi:MAG: M67 family metallopeptidase [Nitrosopumilus sp.]|nr:M67 family metallopeptidase [Nitrosopumilus sp.]MDA7959016.1 M67 family metallopeptidase [Nitrosopumilus sp.]MDA7959025.1 M67 family metallopeptidase [Nitrosopumilus sp.]
MIEIPGAVLDELEAHAGRSDPREACAVLLGRGGRVERAELAENADASASSFSISPARLLEIYGAAEGRGEEVVGIFHSHPASAARPSGTDERYMAANAVPWVIYSGVDGTFAAFEAGGGVREIGIRRT